MASQGPHQTTVPASRAAPNSISLLQNPLSGGTPARAAEGMVEKGASVSRPSVQRRVDGYGNLTWKTSKRMSGRVVYA